MSVVDQGPTGGHSRIPVKYKHMAHLGFSSAFHTNFVQYLTQHQMEDVNTDVKVIYVKITVIYRLNI